ncbi:MAG: MFS transporter, partial [Aureliella sp.]
YLCVIAALLLLPRDAARVHCQISVLKSMSEGVSFLRERSNLRLMLMLVALFAFGAAPMVTLLPAIAKNLLNEEVAGYSILMTSFGVGAAIAGVFMAFYRPEKFDQRWIIGAAFVIGISQSAIAFLPGMIFAVSCCFFAGMAFVGTMIELGTGLLSQTPDEFRGRISGVQQLCFRVAQPFGGLIAGLLAQNAGVKVAFVVFGTALIVGVVVTTYVPSPRHHTQS